MRNDIIRDQECPTRTWRSIPWLPVNPSLNSDVPLTVTLRTLYPSVLSELESSRVSILTRFGVFNFTHNSSSFIIDLKDIPLCRGCQGQGREEKLHTEEPPFQWDGWTFLSSMGRSTNRNTLSQPDWCTWPFQNKQGEMLCLVIGCVRTHNYFSKVFFLHTGIRTEPGRNSWSDLFIFGLSHQLPTLIFDWEDD